MRILIHTIKSPYTGESVGGAETSLRLIAEEFAQKGHQVTYLSTSIWKFFSSRIEQIDGVQVVHYPYIGPVKIFNQGIIPGFILGFINSWFLHMALKKIGLERYDVIHTFYELFFLQKVIKLREKQSYNYQIVMRMAGLYWFHDISANPSRKNKYERIFNKVDGINYISEGLKDLTEQVVKDVGLSYNPQYTFSGDIGVKIDGDLPRWKKDQMGRDTFRIIVATRFSRLQKRHDLLVEAVKSLSKKNDIKVNMIGEGGNRKYIQSLIQKYGLNEVFEVVSFMPQHDLWNNMLEADLLCHPTENEGLGKIIIESMAIGLPVLASDISPLNTYIKDGINGFLVKNEVDEWEKKLKSIIEERNNLVEISSEEVKYARNKYDSKRNINMYEKQFTKLLEN